jgi:hypothetical protein
VRVWFGVTSKVPAPMEAPSRVVMAVPSSSMRPLTALVVCQLKVLDMPSVMAAGVAEKLLIWGPFGSVTVTVTELMESPAALLAFRTKVVVMFRVGVTMLPMAWGLLVSGRTFTPASVSMRRVSAPTT